jgi:hypothetical protein
MAAGGVSLHTVAAQQGLPRRHHATRLWSRSSRSWQVCLSCGGGFTVRVSAGVDRVPRPLSTRTIVGCGVLVGVVGI